ncbi:hypothetical protein EUX98_g5162 [Antrodiella citrinella]|uniref:DUF6593 domain-containing protein n=1 Tax=Antrodiella citrinella TaxID=2447956 RepID=A0A4V3XIF8_9APHY|nr:hypothetical protein EUX98_g5162 [Antrodiella citrinella]
MDTQLTLVDVDAPLPDRHARTVLTFSRDSLLNTTLRIRGSEHVVYVIKTNATSSRTVVNRMIPGSEQAVVQAVRIDRNELLPDKVTFEGFPVIKMKDWLKKRSFKDPRAQNRDEATQYIWKPTNLREIALYIEDMPFLPVAWFRASVPGVESASLSLQAEAEPIQDAILASLIVVEQKYRVRSKRSATNFPNRMPVLPM